MTESVENYLETIYILSEKNEKVRAIDVCNKLGFSKPTVSVTMKNLREKGFIYIAENGEITLTEKGKETAEKTFDKHRILTNLFISLGVSPETAENDACKTEHDLSTETFEKIKEYYLKKIR